LIVLSDYLNNRVFNERMRVHNKIFERDKNNNYKRNVFETTRLVTEMNTISVYGEMLWRFWKPIRSFYEEFMRDLEEED